MNPEDFKTWMIEEMRFSWRTVNNTIRLLKRMERLGCDLEDRDSINDYIREVWTEKGNSTANGYIKIANRYLKFTRRKQLKYFKEYDSFVVKVSSPEERTKLINAARGIGKREYCMIMLLFGTGVRLEEATNLKLENIFYEKISVRGKGQKVREIFLPPEVRSAIESYIEVREKTDKEYLFTTQNRRVSYEYFRMRCKKIAAKAGVNFHPHMARHTYATELLKQGVSIYYVSRLLGHEDLSSTQIYLHPSQDAAIQEAKKVKFFLSKGDAAFKYPLPGRSISSKPAGTIVFLFAYLDQLEESRERIEVSS